MELDDKTIIKKLKSNNQDIIDEGFEELYLKYATEGADAVFEDRTETAEQEAAATTGDKNEDEE